MLSKVAIVPSLRFQGATQVYHPRIVSYPRHFSKLIAHASIESQRTIINRWAIYKLSTIAILFYTRIGFHAHAEYIVDVITQA